MPPITLDWIWLTVVYAVTGVLSEARSDDRSLMWRMGLLTDKPVLPKVGLPVQLKLPSNSPMFSLLQPGAEEEPEGLGAPQYCTQCPLKIAVQGNTPCAFFITYSAGATVTPLQTDITTVGLLEVYGGTSSNFYEFCSISSLRTRRCTLAIPSQIPQLT